MTHFHGLYHRNRALRYVEGIVELVKILFRGLKGQFYVKKANFRGLMAKIGDCRPIVASKTHPWSYFLEIIHENCDPRNVGGVLEFRKLDFRGL